MDGDRAPLGDLVAMATRHDVMLVLDEAHATGVYGAQGRGLGADLEGASNIISLHTCGKGLGAAGALVCLPRLYRDFLVNRGRAFIYSTAPSPLMAAVVRAALKLCAHADGERERLMGLVDRAGARMWAMGLAPSGSQIQPVIVGADTAATRLAALLREKGFDIRAIRPPTVPEGTARLRIALTLNVDQVAVDALFAALAEEMVPA
jgi:8-amino-7-oxononanoate synthase